MRLLLFSFFVLMTFASASAQKKGFKTLIAEHSFTAPDSSSSTLAEILERHKGKIIYIDFWASWCGPCVAEMPHSRRLHEKFADDSDIVFVYLSIDDADPAWLKAMERLKIGETGEHYRRSRADIEPLMRALYIYSIPHYWIIDKEGNPHSLDAMPPSDPKLEKVLLKLK